MKKLTLKKIQIAAIGNANFLKGGSENSNIDTICDPTGDVSVTSCVHTDCDCQDAETSSNGTTTRANGSQRTAGLNCFN